MVLTACQRDASPAGAHTPSVPTSPTSLLAVPGSTFSDKPFMSIGDVQGEWDVTITADTSCQQIPVSLRTRTYLVTIGWHFDGKSYEARLDESRFFYPRESFRLIPQPGGAVVSLSSLYALGTWHEHAPLAERLDAGGYLEIMGTADVSIDKSTSTVSTPLAGSLGYCAVANQSGDSSYPSSCPNISHCMLAGLTLTRR